MYSFTGFCVSFTPPVPCSFNFQVFPWGGAPGWGKGSDFWGWQAGWGSLFSLRGGACIPGQNSSTMLQTSYVKFSSFEISTIPELMPKFSSSLPARASLA